MNQFIFYLLIFLAQSINLSLITIRGILTARKEKVVNVICGFVQCTVYVVSTYYVLQGITTDIGRVISYLLGCGFGCYFGMVLDEMLAIGTDMLTVIVDKKDADRLALDIREKGFALTTIDAKSLEKDKSLLMIGLKRKKEKKLIHQILKDEKTAVIIDESVGTYGGYYR